MVMKEGSTKTATRTTLQELAELLEARVQEALQESVGELLDRLAEADETIQRLSSLLKAVNALEHAYRCGRVNAIREGQREHWMFTDMWDAAASVAAVDQECE
jgi:hypothetical protein